MSKTIEIKLSVILQDLKDGYTRLKTDKNYDPKVGSIQEKYGLNGIQVFELFKHDKLKGKKTIIKKEPAFLLIDDIDSPTGEALVEVVEEVESTQFPSSMEDVTEEVEETTSQENNDIKEVSTPDTQTSTDMNDAAEEAKAEPVEPDNQDNAWL